MNILNTSITAAWYNINEYTDEGVVPRVGETDFHEVHHDMTLEFDDGRCMTLATNWKGDYSEIEVSGQRSHNTLARRFDSRWLELYAQRIVRTDWLYLRELIEHWREPDEFVEKELDPSKILIGILFQFSNGRRMRVFSGEFEEREPNTLYMLRPDENLLVVFDTERYTYRNMTKDW